MTIFVLGLSIEGPMALFMGGSLALFVSAFLAVGALCVKRGQSPGRAAIGHAVPVALVCAMAMALSRPDIAIGVIFGTSVAALSSVTGLVCILHPLGPAPQRWRKILPFTLAVSLLAFVVGFGGFINWQGIVALAVEGLALFQLWREPEEPAPGELLKGADGKLECEPARMTAGIGWLRRFDVLVLLAMAVGLGSFGAWAAVDGAVGYHVQTQAVAPSAMATTLLSMALALPMVYTGQRRAREGEPWFPITVQAGVVLICICAILPAVAMVPYAPYMAAKAGEWAHIATPAEWSEMPQPMVYPLLAWRIDAPLLIVLSLLQLPVALGKWVLGREEGVALIVGYCVYVTAVLVNIR